MRRLQIFRGLRFNLCGLCRGFHSFRCVVVFLRLGDALHLPVHLHEFLAGNGLFLKEIRANLLDDILVFGKQCHSLVVTVLKKLLYDSVYLGCGIISAVKNSPSVQIFIFYGFKAHKPEFFRHSVLSNHSPGKLCRLLDIVGCAGSYRIKEYGFRCAAAHVCDKLCTKLIFRHKIFLFFGSLHNISQSSHGTGHNGDLLDGLGILLKSRHKSMTHLMICYYLLFFTA